jgi:hypothetical protein
MHQPQKPTDTWQLASPAPSSKIKATPGKKLRTKQTSIHSHTEVRDPRPLPVSGNSNVTSINTVLYVLHLRTTLIVF